MPDSPLQRLVDEFVKEAKLGDVAAYRSAFCALAYNQGWPQVKIARYMGITRARVGQRITKFRWYVDRYKMPQLAKLLAGGDKIVERRKTDPGYKMPESMADGVRFDQSDWNRPEFVLGLLGQFE